MAIDLLADILDEDQPALSDNWLSHLADRPLTSDESATQPSSSIFNNPGLVNPNQAGAVVSKIEVIFEKIASCILDEKEELVIKLKTRRKQGAKTRDADTGSTNRVLGNETRPVRFPSKSPKEAWKFSEFWKGLEAIPAYLKQLHYSGFSSFHTKLW
jgi:meiotic recombination protein SPO11